MCLRHQVYFLISIDISFKYVGQKETFRPNEGLQTKKGDCQRGFNSRVLSDGFFKRIIA